MSIKRNKGFTLIEIMVVVMIIGMLTAITTPKLISLFNSSKIETAKADLARIKTALEIYQLDNGRYPSSEQGLEALVNKPHTSPEPTRWRKGGYLDKTPFDPWGSEYQYFLNDEDTSSFNLFSLGADKAIGGTSEEADITL